MRAPISLALLSLIWLVSAGGCGDGDPSVTGDGGTGDDGGAGDSDAGDGVNNSCAKDRPPATTSGGVLTAYPESTVNLAPNSFALHSVNYEVRTDGDSRGSLLTVFLEVENTSAAVECGFLPDIYFKGQELVGLMSAPPHYPDFDTSLPSACLSPGDVGVISAVTRGIEEADLGDGVLDVDLNPDTIGSYFPATDGPTIVSENIVDAADGYMIQGQLEVPNTIHNYTAKFFGRDDRGLLVAEVAAFPNDLGTLPAGTIDYETSPSQCSFDETLSFQRWINGPEGALRAVALEPKSERSQIAERRRAQMADLRATR